MKGFFLWSALLLLSSHFSPAQVRYAGTEMNIRLNEYETIDGFLWLKNGEYFTGKLSFKSHTEEKPTGSKYPSGEPVMKTVRYLDAYIINGKQYNWNEVAIYGSIGDKFMRNYCEYSRKGKLQPEKDEEKNFHPGFIMFNDSVKTEGLLAIREGYLLFAKNEESKVEAIYDLSYGFYQRYRAKHAVQMIEGKSMEYFPRGGKYVLVEDKKWEPAYVITFDNKRIEGKGDKVGRIKAYGSKGFGEFLFRPANKMATVYYPSQIKAAGIISENDEHMSFDNAFYSTNSLTKNLINSVSEVPEYNFHPGTVLFNDGTLLTGKVRCFYYKGTGFFFLSNTGELRTYYIDPKIVYYAQTINGVENKYLRVGKQYVDWVFANNKVSYFRNPYPTHPRKGLNNVVNFIGESVANFAIDTLSKLAVKKSVEESKTVNEAIDNAVKISKFANDLEYAVNNNDDSDYFFFKEYVVLVNGKDPTVVYAKNIEGLMNAWMLTCPDFSSFDKDKVKRMTDIDNLNESIKTLNESKCL